MFIDVSRHNSAPPKTPIDWARARAAGVRTAIIRCATGARKDDWFDRHWTGAKAAGIERIGVYAYYVTEVDPLQQVDALLDFTRGDFGTEPPTVDCERRADERLAPWDFPKRVAYTNNVRRYLLALEQYRPRIYTSKWEWRAITTAPEWITEYSLWLAAYPGPPELPDEATAYTVHQYTRSARVDGIAGPVDLNREVGAPEPPSVIAGLAAGIRALALAARTELG